MIQEKGINDMPRGWTKENNLNFKIYQVWKSMLTRVYSEKYHERHPTYINSTLQLELHWLSYFVKHYKEITGYNDEKFINGELVLDKDIKSDGQNKEYSIDNCTFITESENSKQAMKTKDYKYLNTVIVQYDMDGNFIRTYNSLKEAEEKTGIHYTCISHCCKGDNNSGGGYIWKYI